MVGWACWLACKYHYYYLDLPKYYFKSYELVSFRGELY
jgi:hypothetical protein